jgi:hypothetical protein
MISSEPELQQAIEQMQRLEQVLAGLRRKIEPDNAALFAVMAEGPMDMLQELEEQVDAWHALERRRKFEEARDKLRKISRPRAEEAKAA